MNWQDQFNTIWVIDYEWSGNGDDADNDIHPLCYTALELKSGRKIFHWIDGTETMPEYDIGHKSLVVSFNGVAEASCHRALNFPMPINMLDLMVEFMRIINGKLFSGDRIRRHNLLMALEFYGLKGVDAEYKSKMQMRALQGHPFTDEERQEMLEYCFTDVEETANLLKAMDTPGDKFALDDIYNATIRAKYMWYLALVYEAGIPVDMEKYNLLKEIWNEVKLTIINKVDLKYNVYENGVFKEEKFKRYVKENNFIWETTPNGMLITKNEYLKDKARTYPELRELYELNVTLGQLRLGISEKKKTKSKKGLSIGKDGRNRSNLWPFNTRTGRNAPSSSGYIFGAAAWVRGFIKPREGTALVYLDYSQQELGIAAALSGDQTYIDAYNSGDVYLATAKATGSVPQDATKESHSDIRAKFKAGFLSIGYGASVKGVAYSTNLPAVDAYIIHAGHHTNFREYWKWSELFVKQALADKRVFTKHGWAYWTDSFNTRNDGKPQSTNTLMNWPIQSTGAEILRRATILLLLNKIKVIALVHDAVMIEVNLEDVDQTVVDAKYLMVKASEQVIGLPIRVNANIVKYPDRYMDEKGENMWNMIWEVVDNYVPEPVKVDYQDTLLEGEAIG